MDLFGRQSGGPSKENVVLDDARADLCLSRTQIAEIFDRSLYYDIITSRAFKRLREIRFLGSIDYLFPLKGRKTKKRHTRFQHSLGVGRLALLYSRHNDLPPEEEMLLVSTALLHDIGHPPLSHSMEPALKARHGISHHSLSEKIIRGQLVGVDRNVSGILRQYEVNIAEVIRILNGQSESPHQFLFSSPLNIDTIDGIIRSSLYITAGALVLAPENVLYTLMSSQEGNKAILDTFWQLKERVYSTLIQSKEGLLADFLAVSYLEERADRHRDNFLSDYEFSTTESNFRRRNPQLFTMLALVPQIVNGEITSENLSDWLLTPETVSMLRNVMGKEISFYRREFYIDYTYKWYTMSDISRRYRQRKIKAMIKVSEPLVRQATAPKAGSDNAGIQKTEDFF